MGFLHDKDAGQECKDGKGLVTEIYYGWTGGYPYMKVNLMIPANLYLISKIMTSLCSLLCMGWSPNCQRRRSMRRAPAASSYAPSIASRYPRYPNPATSFPQSSPGYPRPSQGLEGFYRSPAWERSAPLASTRLGQIHQLPRY